jgi:hypothetical protein
MLAIGAIIARTELDFAPRSPMGLDAKRAGPQHKTQRGSS